MKGTVEVTDLFKGAFLPCMGAHLAEVRAATNRNLRENVRKGLMRKDFYYRINVLSIELPPLRERKGDLPLLINHFLTLFSQEKSKPTLPDSLMTMYC